MRTSFLIGSLLLATAVGTLWTDRVFAQNGPPLSGGWTWNRAVSELPAEIGFNQWWMPAAGGTTGGRRGSGDGGRAPAPIPPPPTGYDAARRTQILVDEVRKPPARLVITDDTTTVTQTNDLGQSRTFHPNGRQEFIEIQGVSVGVASKREANQLVVTYTLDPSKTIRYTYATTASPARLVVDVQLLERGNGDKARLIYDAGIAVDSVPTSASSPPASAPTTPPTQKPATVDAIDSRPGSELKGLKTLGIVIEDLSAQSVACGLSADAIEGAVSRRLTAGGLTVRRNSDDDTYVYVNIITNTLPGGQCASRYDAFLYSSAAAKLPYRDQQVLVQASLLHRGGMAINSRTDLAPAVVRALEEFADRFATQIRDANK